MSAPAIETAVEPTTPATPATPTESSPFAPLKSVPAAPEPAAPKPASWTEGLSADELAYIGSKGWDKEGKGPADVLRSYRNIERLRGVDAEKLVRLPDWSKPEEVAEYRARIGVPDAADKYENHDVQLPIGTLDASAIAKLSHRIGANQMQHTELLNGTGELLTELFKSAEEDRNMRRAIERQELIKEVGQANLEVFDQDVKRAQERFKEYLPKDLLEGIATVGEAPFQKFLAAVGRGMREQVLPAENRPNSSPPTAAEAKAQLDAFKRDTTFLAKLAAGDGEAKARLENAQTIAFGPT